MSSRPELRLDWCTHEAAKYAVENWHYSRSLPAGKSSKIGVWENGKFAGVVIFGRGANMNIAKPYNITQLECCELVRIALTTHIAPVSRILSLAMKFLKTQSPGLRLIVSYADPEQGHHGGIYQAGNWIYTGKTKGGTAQLKMANGKIFHKRSAMSKYGTCEAEKLNAVWTANKEKHRYLMPLDDEMRKRIEPLRKPYPKCVRSEDSGTIGNQPIRGGATPTRTLQDIAKQ